jgi:hypothetical protein
MLRYFLPSACRDLFTHLNLKIRIIMKQLINSFIGFILLASPLFGLQESTFVVAHYDYKKGEEYLSLWLDYTNTDEIPLSLTADFLSSKGGPFSIVLTSDQVGVGVYDLSPWPKNNPALNNSLKNKLRCGIRDLPAKGLRQALGDKFVVTIMAILPADDRNGPLPREVILHRVEFDYTTYKYKLVGEGKDQPLGGVVPEPPVVEPGSPSKPHPTASVPNQAPTRSIALFTKEEVDAQVAKAVAGLFSQEDVEQREVQAFNRGQAAGIAEVQAAPASFGLVQDSNTLSSPFIQGWSYVEDLGWIHISPDLFPFVFVEKLKSWVLVHDEAGVLAYFIYKSQQWASYEELLDLN